MDTMKSFAIVLCLVGCRPTEKESTHSDNVTGAFLHTYSAEVIDPATGEVMGTRTVRDTIFIVDSGDKFEVSNRKWFDNDYDDEGWKAPQSEADKAMPTFLATYDTTQKKLVPTEKNKKHTTLYIGEDRIYWGDEKALEYERIAEN